MNHIDNQNISNNISFTFQDTIKLKSIKKYQINENKIHVLISRIGYILLTFVLQYLHFHKFLTHDIIGINSKLQRVGLHFGQGLLHHIIHFSHDFNLYINTEEKLQKSVQNINKTI